MWNGLLVDKKSPGLYPDIVLDAQDAAYATYCGYLKGNNKGTKTKWARIALSDLTGDWPDIALNESCNPCMSPRTH